MSWARVTVLLSVALVALVPAATARADGDPASDFLLSQKVFLPFDAQISPTLSEELVSLASAAGRQGDPIRVAVIATPADLGSVTALWKRPRQYARFLASEVSFAYHGRLLIVMPQGLGTYQLGHSSTRQQRELAGLRVQPGANGLASTAISAVQRLAATNGITLKSRLAAAPARRSGNDLLKLGLIVAAVLVVLAALLPIVMLRRRRGAGS